MKVLFVTYGGGHVNALAPVALLAREAGHDISFLALTTARCVAIEAGLDPVPLSDFMGLAGAGAEDFGRELAAELGDGPVELSESIAYLGASFAELAEDVGIEKARAIYRTTGRARFLPRRFLERIVDRLRPDIVVATSAPRSERAAILAAGHLGIPAVCIVDLFATAEAAWVCDNHYANKVCVLSDRVKDRLVDVGRNAGDIVVTGNPAFDSLLSDEEQIAAGREIRKDRKWDDRFVVAWASQQEPERHPFTGQAGDPSLPQRIEESLLGWASGSPNRALVVRHHPSEQRPVPAENSSVRVSGRDESVEMMLHSCDCLVTIASTVGLQAALAGLPVITYDASVLTQGAPYSEMGISLGVTRIEELAVALELVSKDGWRPTGGLVSPGNAAPAVLRCMESLIR